MDKNTVWTLAQEQLAMDLGCEAECLDSDCNAVFPWRDHPGRRKYGSGTPFLEIVLWRGRLFAACAGELLPWAEENLLPRKPEWLFLPQNHRRIEAGLAPFGYEIGDARHFYLPTLPCPETRPLRPVRWYEEADLEQFRGDDTWDEALAFNPYTPDMLAVAALDEQGTPIAMAGASRDGARLWQIGIRVLPEWRGQGLGVNLTALLKDELLRRDIVPFYSTAESHILSQNVGLSAGFRPAWAYLYAQAKGT